MLHRSSYAGNWLEALPSPTRRAQYTRAVLENDAMLARRKQNGPKEAVAVVDRGRLTIHPGPPRRTSLIFAEGLARTAALSFRFAVATGKPADK